MPHRARCIALLLLLLGMLAALPASAQSRTTDLSSDAADAGDSDAVGGANVKQIRDKAREEALGCASARGTSGAPLALIPAGFALVWVGRRALRPR